jgi:hypothetical protein
MSKHIIAFFFLLNALGCTSRNTKNPFAAEGLVNAELPARFGEVKTENGVSRANSDADVDLNWTTSKTNADAALKTWTDKSFLLNGLFANRPAPYPGAFTRTVTCEGEYLPETEELQIPGGWIKHHVLFANDRRIFGVCTPEARHFRVLYFFVYCTKPGHLIEGKAHFPAATDKNVLKKFGAAFRCAGT